MQKNELEIQKKGNCKCSCIPTSFKISKNDEKIIIDNKKTKDGINLETDVHNITFKWGRDVTGASSQEAKETQNTVKEMMNNQYLKSRFNIIELYKYIIK